MNITHQYRRDNFDCPFSAVAIALRVVHDSIEITYRFAHVFPSTQMEVMSSLNNIMTISGGCVEK